MRTLNLLTFKPILYVLNKKAGGKNLDNIDGAGNPDPRFIALLEYFKKLSFSVISNSKLEVLGFLYFSNVYCPRTKI